MTKSVIGHGLKAIPMIKRVLLLTYECGCEAISMHNNADEPWFISTCIKSECVAPSMHDLADQSRRAWRRIRKELAKKRRKQSEKAP